VHIITKVLIIVNLVVCLVLSQFVWISLAGNVQWREKYEIERARRHQDKHLLEQAYDELLAAQAANQKSSSQYDVELASLYAAQQVLEVWHDEAQIAAKDSETIADQLTAATAPVCQIDTSYKGFVSNLQGNVAEMGRIRADVLSQRGARLLEVAEAHDRYAEKHEAYRRLEHQMFLLQEELERREDQRARYRWLRPDIQKDLGDNGPVIFGQVSWAQGGTLQLNKGKRDGVQHYQVYTITRGGSTIAIVKVVDVQNETSECVVIDLVNEKVKPMAGDEAQTRLFMSRLGR
jgi:hypothetical protein